MLHRTVDGDLIVITQPAHAWISGQIARAWGNRDLGMAPPDREVRLAAEQHDIAWLDWEAAPTLNPSTGLPRAFSEVPTLEHLAIWGTATRRSLVYGLYPALLISMHGTYLYRRFHDFEADSSDEAAAAKSFLESERTFQRQAIASLVDAGRRSTGEAERDRRLVSLWDAMSLAICMGIDRPRTFEAVTTLGGSIDITMRVADESLTKFSLTPWPFQVEAVRLGCEGRRLAGTFDDESAMREALADAPAAPLEFELARG